MQRVRDDLLAGPELDDPPQVHDGDSIGHVPRHPDVVRDEHQRQAEFVPELEQEIHDARADRDVEHGHRLVRDDELRLEDDRPRDGDPLPLTAAQLVRIPVNEVRCRCEFRVLERLRDQILPILEGIRHAVNRQRLRDRIHHGEARVERFVRILEDHLHAATEVLQRSSLQGGPLKDFRRRVQMIFQDPYESLNPRFTVMDTVAEPLTVHGVTDSLEDREDLIAKALEHAELAPASDYMYRYPHELSGGQRQRVAIARAIVLQPEFIVADEPVSMLDVSIRAGVMNLLLQLRDEFRLTLLFISHDVGVTRYMSDRIAVMYLGRIVELGVGEEVISKPLHPYTQALLTSVPVPDPKFQRGRARIWGELPSPIDLPSGCTFHPRCPYAQEICKTTKPELREIVPGHFAECHFAGEVGLSSGAPPAAAMGSGGGPPT